MFKLMGKFVCCPTHALVTLWFRKGPIQMTHIPLHFVAGYEFSQTLSCVRPRLPRSPRWRSWSGRFGVRSRLGLGLGLGWAGPDRIGVRARSMQVGVRDMSVWVGSGLGQSWDRDMAGTRAHDSQDISGNHIHLVHKISRLVLIASRRSYFE